MLCPIGCDKHGFYLIVIQFKHVDSCPSFDVTYISLNKVISFTYFIGRKLVKCSSANIHIMSSVCHDYLT